MSWKQLYTIKRGMSRPHRYVFIALEVFREDKFALELLRALVDKPRLSVYSDLSHDFLSIMSPYNSCYV